MEKGQRGQTMKKQHLKKGLKKESIPLSPEQLDILVKGRKIVEVFVSENTLFIKLDDGSQIEHKVILTSKKNKHPQHIIHTLVCSIDEKKHAEYKKYDSMYR